MFVLETESRRVSVRRHLSCENFPAALLLFRIVMHPSFHGSRQVAFALIKTGANAASLSLWCNNIMSVNKVSLFLPLTTLLLSRLLSLSGLDELDCSLPLDGRRVPLTLLSEESFRECHSNLTLTDYLIVIFSGISVSVAAIMASFFLASTVHCFQRLSKGSKDEEEEGND